MQMKSVDNLVESAVLKTVEQCKEKLKAYYGERLAAVILFGSAARGEMREESDIDLLVLFSQSFDYFEELDHIIEVLYPLQFEASHWISAKPAAEADFEVGTIQLYRNAKEEGIVL